MAAIPIRRPIGRRGDGWPSARRRRAGSTRLPRKSDEQSLSNRIDSIPEVLRRGPRFGCVASGDFAGRGIQGCGALRFRRGRNRRGRTRSEFLRIRACPLERSFQSEILTVPLLCGQPVSALEASSLEYIAAVIGPHPHGKSVGFELVTVVGLVGPFHDRNAVRCDVE